MNKLLTKRRGAQYSHYRQQGNSIIALPIILFTGMTIILIAANINSAISTKASLERLSYALTSIVATSHTDKLMTSSVTKKTPKDAPIVTQALANALLEIANRQFKQRQVGIQVAQLQQPKTTGAAKATVFQAGVPCSANKEISSLKNLSPLGKTQGLNRGQRADLFQVSVCLKNVSLLTETLGLTDVKGFSAGYFQSESLLIGRKVTGVGL